MSFLCFMESLRFGNTSIYTSRIGLGLAALGRPGYINLGHGDDLVKNDAEAMKSNAVNMLDTAYKVGIRYFDAARSYGKAEEFLAAWMEQGGKGVTLGSKWGYTYTAGWSVHAEQHEVKEHTAKVLQRQWQESKALLGTSLKIYQIHSATLESAVLDNADVLDRLWCLKASGMIIGLSLSGTAQQDTLDKAMTILKGGESLFQSVQVTWNVLEQAATEVLRRASEQGMGIIVKEALANGRLTARNSDPDFKEKKAILEAMASRYKVGMDALSMAFVLHQPWANIVLSGAATEAQLLSNLKALQVQLSREDIAILKSLAEPSEVYWKKRAELVWN